MPEAIARHYEILDEVIASRARVNTQLSPDGPLLREHTLLRVQRRRDRASWWRAAGRAEGGRQ